MTLSDVISKRTVFGKDAFLTDNASVTGSVTAKSAIVTDNSSSPAVQITQTGSGPALMVEDETSPDATPFSVQADGRVLIGTDTPIPLSNSKLQIIGFQRCRVASNDTSGSGIAFDKARGTIASPTIVSSGDRNGFIDFYGHNGTDYEINARIQTNVDGAPSSANMPGRIAFATRETTTLTEKMRIAANGNVGIGTGSPSSKLHVDGDLTLSSSTTAATVGAAGGASALPATPEGYLVVNINGTARKIPYYNV
jgi:hypothetical protein